MISKPPPGNVLAFSPAAKSVETVAVQLPDRIIEPQITRSKPYRKRFRGKKKAPGPCSSEARRGSYVSSVARSRAFIAGVGARIARVDCFIYALCSPEDAKVRYIGKTTSPERRLREHVRDSRRLKTPVACWIRSLLSRGVTPRLMVAERCPEEAWEERERLYIAAARSAPDGRILNVTPGGSQPSPSPRSQRIATIKREIRRSHRAGILSEHGYRCVRYGVEKRPDLFGSLADIVS